MLSNQEGIVELKNESGGTLIEALIAMVLLAVLVTGLNASILSLINSNISAKELSAATNNGYQLLETLRRDSYSAIETSYDVVGEKFHRSWSVTGDTTQKKIDLTVSWPLHSQKHAISLSTIISRP